MNEENVCSFLTLISEQFITAYSSTLVFDCVHLSLCQSVLCINLLAVRIFVDCVCVCVMHLYNILFCPNTVVSFTVNTFPYREHHFTRIHPLSYIIELSCTDNIWNKNTDIYTWIFFHKQRQIYTTFKPLWKKEILHI